MPDFNYNSNLNYNAGSLNFTKDSGNPVWDKRLFTFAHNVDNFLIDNKLLLPPYSIDYGTGQTPLEFLQQYKIKTYQQLDVQSLEKINTQLREMGKSQILEQRLTADVLAVLLKAPGFENVSLTDLADRLGQAEYEPFPSEKFNFSSESTSQSATQIQPTILHADEPFPTPDNTLLDNAPNEPVSEMGYTGPIQTKNVLIGTISPQIVRAEIDRILNLHRENPLFPDLSNDESTSVQPRFASNEYNAAFNPLLPSLDALSLRPISSLTPAQQEAFRQEIMSNLTSRNLSRYIAGVLLAEKTGVITKADVNNVQWDQFLSKEHIEIPFTLLDDNLFHWPMLQKYQPEPSVLATYTDDVNATARVTPPTNIPPINNQDIMPNIPSPAVASIDGVAVSAPDLRITDPQQQTPDSGFLNMDMPELAHQPSVSIPTNIPPVNNQDIMPNMPSPAVASIDGVAVSAPDLQITDLQQQTPDSGFLNMDMPELAHQTSVSIPTNIPSVNNQDIMPNMPSPAVASIDGISLKQVEPIDLPISDRIAFNENNIPSYLNFEMQTLAKHTGESNESTKQETTKQKSQESNNNQSQIDDLQAKKQSILKGRSFEQLSDEEQTRIQAIDHEINALQAQTSTSEQNAKSGAGQASVKSDTTFPTQTAQTTFSPSQNGKYGSPDRQGTASHLESVPSSEKTGLTANNARTGFGSQKGKGSVHAKGTTTPKEMGLLSPAAQTPSVQVTPPVQSLQAIPTPTTGSPQLQSSSLASEAKKKKKEAQNLPPEAVVQQPEGESFWTWKNILLILAAVATLGIGAYFIIRYKKKADDAKSQSSALQSTVNDLQAQVNELQNPSNSANTSLASNNNGLSQSTALASVSTNITNTSANPVNTDLLGNDYSRG